VGGVDPSAAIAVEGGAYPVVVEPGETEICVLNGPEGMTAASAHAAGELGGVCGTIADAETRGLADSTEAASGAPVVIGLVPNGNTSVSVTNTNGTTEDLPVTNNVYEITSGTPTSVTMKDATGATVTRHIAVPTHPPASAPAGQPAP
jgi:hypothetical protein